MTTTPTCARCPFMRNRLWVACMVAIYKTTTRNDFTDAVCEVYAGPHFIYGMAIP